MGKNTQKNSMGPIGPNEQKLNLHYLDNEIEFNNKVLRSEFGDELNNYEPINIIKGYKKYLVDTNGIIYNRENLTVKKVFSNKKGYVKVSMGTGIIRQVHRLVLMSFRPITNPEKYHVNHIDGNPSNNRLDNLEWVTNGQNKQHALALKLGLHNKSVGLISRNIDTGEIREFTHIYEAASALKLPKDAILHRLSKPANKIWHDGLQFKRAYDPTEWLPIDTNISNIITNFDRQPVKVLLMRDNIEKIFATMLEAAKYLKCSLTAIWKYIKASSIKACCPGRIANSTNVFQIKLARDNTPWCKYPTIHHAVAHANLGVSYPIIVIKPDGEELIFDTLAECAKYFNVGATTIAYKLSLRKTIPQRDGNIYYPYLEWYNMFHK